MQREFLLTAVGSPCHTVSRYVTRYVTKQSASQTDFVKYRFAGDRVDGSCFEQHRSGAVMKYFIDPAMSLFQNAVIFSELRIMAADRRYAHIRPRSFPSGFESVPMWPCASWWLQWQSFKDNGQHALGRVSTATLYLLRLEAKLSYHEFHNHWQAGCRYSIR